MLNIGHCPISLLVLATVSAFTSSRRVWYYTAPVTLGHVWGRELMGLLKPEEVELYINYATV